jgi:polyphosphate kinase 2 (PPK2 family)
MKTIFQDIDLIEKELDTKESKIALQELKNSINLLKSKRGLSKLVEGRHLSKAIKDISYEQALTSLQVELIKLQNWIFENKKRVMIIFEGRDAAGKGGAIKRFIQYLNPRKFRVVALPKPTDVELGQFYFQRYFQHLPNEGEIVFFDRSWYNRAIVEPVFDFCSKDKYSS